MSAIEENLRDPSSANDRSEWFRGHFDAVAKNVAHLIRGKSQVIQSALTCLFAEGHLLIEDVPGVGKTSLAKAIAFSIDAEYKRVQFTPDLLPSDVIGAQMRASSNSDRWILREGPIFTNVFLADEINRASPKTQSALLEVMEERQVTIGDRPYEVPRPFVVIATQNPVEGFEGTYRLPEAQLDRFMMRIKVGYPGREAENQIVQLHRRDATAERLTAKIDGPTVMQMIDHVKSIEMSDHLSGYIVDLVERTRAEELRRYVRLPVSPRGSISLSMGARAMAASHGRGYVVPDDIRAVIHDVLGHRLLLTPQAQLDKRDTKSILDEIMTEVPLPRDRDQRFDR